MKTLINFVAGLFGASAAAVSPWLYGLAALAFVAYSGALFGAGWQVNGWRIERAQLTAQVKGFEIAIGDQTKKMDILADLAREQLKRDRAQTQAIKDGKAAIDEYVANGGTCLLSDSDAGILRANAIARGVAGEHR